MDRLTPAERQLHIENLRFINTRRLIDVATEQDENAYYKSITAAIAALKREQQIELQPSPDLEPVRKFVDILERWMTEDQKLRLLPHELLSKEQIQDLRSLLAEVERQEKELSILRQAVGLATTAVPSMEMDVADPIGMMSRVVSEVKCLREENARMKAALEEIRDEAKVRYLCAYDEIRAGCTPEYYRGAQAAYNDLAYHSARLLTAITKAAEKGLS